ncbi:MAG: NAD(P)-binding domain-containing protein [Gammaproteobacteria bacterium]
MKRIKYLVVGAGPAGLQMGYCFKQKSQDYLIVERGPGAGTFFDTFPRHRTLISINKRFTGSDHPDFNMRHDWNSLWTEDYGLKFTDYDEEYFPSADRLVDYLNDFASKYDLNVKYNTDITSIERDGDGYVATAADGEKYYAQTLLMGTGFARPMAPDIKGIEHAVNYWDMSVDRRDFENQRVLIIGKGNSGFETADHLVSAAAMIHVVSPNSLNMAWKSHYVGHLRAVNNNFLDTYQLKSQNAVIDADVDGIEKTADGTFRVTFRYKHAQGEVEALVYDQILCCAGFRVDDQIFGEGCRPDLTPRGKFPELTPEFESVNCKNMFFIGTLTHSLDFRKTTSGFIHGFRYNVVALEKILARRNDKAALPETVLDSTATQLAKHVLERTNTSGALWQQPGYLADYFYFDDDGRVHFGEQMPLEYVKQYVAHGDRPTFTVSLEYGDPIEGDPFCVERIHRENVQDARSSQFLHPVIRCFNRGHLTSEHHVIEDLESRWVEAIHFEPLAMFLEPYFVMRREPAEAVEA